MSVLNFDDFSYSINEGNEYKKEYGIIGPFSDWGYKIKTACPEQGGNLSPGQIIVSNLNSPENSIKLKYLYGEGRESEEIEVPDGSFIIEGTPQNPILQTKKNTKWFGSDENRDTFDDFINSFLESKHFKIEEEDIEDDIYSILDTFEIESSISEVNKKRDLFWTAKLNDGSEMEIKKRDRDNLFKVLKFYFSPDLHSTGIEISHEKPGYEVIYNTKNGKFMRKCSKLGEITSDPIHKYLFAASSKKDSSLYNEPVLNYLNSILKSHDWRPQEKIKSEEFIAKENEIKEIKKILSNTISESDLDEIYTRAREKYSPSKK